MFAIARRGETDIRIRLLSLSGGSDREITLRNWPNISGLDWSPDGKGLYCGVESAQGSAVFYVDLNGSGHVVWQARDLIKSDTDFVAGKPSPDGRHLAISRVMYNSNVWILEGY